MLVVAAVHLAGQNGRCPSQLERARAYLGHHGGSDGLRARYGRDKTFAVPILTNCALAGLVAWSQVAPLPFEWACIPQSFYRWAQLPVVSYAIPALVAMGQARFLHSRPSCPVTRLVRRAAIAPSLRVLERMQPDSGGYLEAVPLTSFVAMSLAATGRLEHRVTREALRFLRNRFARMVAGQSTRISRLGQRHSRSAPCLRTRTYRRRWPTCPGFWTVSTGSDILLPGRTRAAGAGPICLERFRTPMIQPLRCWPVRTGRV